MLFEFDDLGGWLGKPVTIERATAVERVVWGWLKPILGLEARPVEISDEVFSWAIELGAIAHENPTGLTRRQMGPYEEDLSEDRRQEILAEAARSNLGSAALQPIGDFPDACDYPDAAW